MTGPESADAAAAGRDPSSDRVHVGLYGPVTVTAPNPDDAIAPAPRAVLGLLCAIGRSVGRNELVDAVGISRSTLGPILTRLPRDLGIDAPIHVTTGGRRSGMLAINRAVVDDDAQLLDGAGDHASDRQRPPLQDLAVVRDHPLVVEALDRLLEISAALRADPSRQVDLDRLIGPVLDHPDDGGSALARLLARRAGHHVATGAWDDAAAAYLQAIEEATTPQDIAEFALRLARIAWDPEVGARARDALREVSPYLGDSVLRDRVEVCLATGAYRDGVAQDDPERRRRLRRALDRIEHHAPAGEFSWSLLRFRDAVAGTVPACATLDVLDRWDALDIDDSVGLGMAQRARFADLLIADRRPAALRTLRAIERHGPGHPVFAANEFGEITARNCWNLAVGRFDRVKRDLADAMLYSGRLPSPTFDQVVLGQSFWLVRELGERASLESHRAGARAIAEVESSTPLWTVAAALLSADLGEVDDAVAELRSCGVLDRPDEVPPGPHRIGILCFVAEILAEVVDHTGDPAAVGAAVEVRRVLDGAPDEGVLMGWPTVFLGARRRYSGLAALATGDRERAVVDLREAVRRDRHSPPLLARSLDALARAMPGPEAGALFAQARAIRSRLRERAQR